MTIELITATTDSYLLGEGPLWDPIRSRLIWVDIREGCVYSGVLDPGGTIEVSERFELNQSVGAVSVSNLGDWIIAGHERIYFRSLDGTLVDGDRILEENSGRRLNDGKADPAGRYLVGTLSLTGPSRTESLVSIDFDGSLRVIDDDLTLSNGLAWSADGHTLYSVDTERQTVYARPYDIESGDVGPRHTFLTIGDGYPDGMTIDAEGHLWIAIWGAGEVRRFSPQGQLVDTVAVPAPHTSSVAFAGPELDTLVITTARQDLTAAQLQAYPLSGHIFTSRPRVSGLSQPLWSGYPLPAPH
ncbi:SMP-30/gluconolactonase/LRE family protein [Leifsonia sp. NPDC058292]|uniref:SMP-30/gluconolactonase/LRE family protein n=1 Tax=Leifsonia sp. NPDC058292 TaxID=3346428 RepID=UPI0036D98F64